jgi:hypothetical protein
MGGRERLAIDVNADGIAGRREGYGGVAGAGQVVSKDDQLGPGRRNRLRTLILSLLAACHLRVSRTSAFFQMNGNHGKTIFELWSKMEVIR